MPANSVDAAVTALNMHHMNAERAGPYLKEIFNVLKPGGRAAIIDHVGVPTANNAPAAPHAAVRREDVDSAGGLRDRRRSPTSCARRPTITRCRPKTRSWAATSISSCSSSASRSAEVQSPRAADDRRARRLRVQSGRLDTGLLRCRASAHGIDAILNRAHVDQRLRAADRRCRTRSASIASSTES